MTTVTFYHSAICPRCRLASLALRSVLEDYPHITLERVEYLTNASAARGAGVRSIPTLSAGDRKLGGFLLSRRGIRKFFDSLEEGGRATSGSV
ncbi:MAG TPA: hypothetical protein VK837_01855 [Longimicrobiales bacterium]|nr:hypothetical protein [Longimicrobiales bacterium]